MIKVNIVSWQKMEIVNFQRTLPYFLSGFYISFQISWAYLSALSTRKRMWKI